MVTVASVLPLCYFSSGGAASGWILELSYYSLWFLHEALPVGFILTNTKVILVANFNAYSTEIYRPQILQAEMIPLAPRSKGSGSKANDKQSHKHYWLRQYIAERIEIPKINLLCLFCPLKNDKSQNQNPVNSNIICAGRLLFSSENF